MTVGWLEYSTFARFPALDAIRIATLLISVGMKHCFNHHNTIQINWFILFTSTLQTEWNCDSHVSELKAKVKVKAGGRDQLKDLEAITGSS